MLLLLFRLFANFGFGFTRSLVAALHSLGKSHTHHAMSKLAMLSLTWLLIDSAYSLTPPFTCLLYFMLFTRTHCCELHTLNKTQIQSLSLFLSLSSRVDFWP